MCSSVSGRKVGNEATTSSTSTKDYKLKGTGIVRSVLKADDTNVSLPCTCLGCTLPEMGDCIIRGFSYI